MHYGSMSVFMSLVRCRAAAHAPVKNSRPTKNITAVVSTARRLDPAAVPGRLPPMVCASPVPAFPTVRVMDDRRKTDGIKKAETCTEPVAECTPGVMGTAAIEDSSRTVDLFRPFYLFGDDIKCLVPADTFIT